MKQKQVFTVSGHFERILWVLEKYIKKYALFLF